MGFYSLLTKVIIFHEILLNKYVRTKRKDLSEITQPLELLTENQKIAVWSGQENEPLRQKNGSGGLRNNLKCFFQKTNILLVFCIKFTPFSDGFEKPQMQNCTFVTKKLVLARVAISLKLMLFASKVFWKGTLLRNLL